MDRAEDTYRKQMADATTIFNAVSTGSYNSYEEAEKAVVMLYIPDMAFSRAGISIALKKLKRFYTCPYECYKRTINKIIEELDEIDKQTPWRESEPEWWLDMMEIRRLVVSKKEKVEENDNKDNEGTD